MKTNWVVFIVTLFLGLFLFAGFSCDDDDDDDDDDDSAGKTTEVDVVRTVTIDEQSGSDSSGPGISDYNQLSSNTNACLAISTCGVAGVLFRDVVEESSSLSIFEIDQAGDSVIQILETVSIYDTRPIAWSLVYDDSCEPHVYSAMDGGYKHWTRSQDQWSSVDIDLDLAGVLGQAPTFIEHIKALIGPDGNTHILFVASETFVHASSSGDDWSIETADTIFMDYNSWFVYDLAVDSDGAVHAGYTNDRHLYYAKLSNGSWETEEVLMRENFDNHPARTASIAISPKGQIGIASNYAQSVQTGSLKFAQLRYNWRTDDGWATKVLADQADGYVGGDGNSYTGGDPHLVFDDQERPHIAFNDISSWHNSNNENETVFGQLRYAFYNGENWEVHTLYKQDGQTESPNPLNDFLYPTIAVSPDGGDLYFAGMQRLIHSDTALYDLEAEIDYTAKFVQAYNHIAD